jgi:hypothetical protein
MNESEIQQIFSSVVNASDHSELNWLLCHQLERNEKIKILEQLDPVRKLNIIKIITNENN